MVMGAAISGAIVTACCGLLAAVIAKLRCRFLVSNNTTGQGCLEWSLACGFTEVRLPAPESKTIEVYPLEKDTLYIKKSN